jgi:hypothetical protein
VSGAGREPRGSGGKRHARSSSGEAARERPHKGVGAEYACAQAAMSRLGRELLGAGKRRESVTKPPTKPHRALHFRAPTVCRYQGTHHRYSPSSISCHRQ